MIWHLLQETPGHKFSGKPGFYRCQLYLAEKVFVKIKTTYMKGLIIYKSKYGATTQYADWLGADLGLPVYSTEKADSQELQAADYVLIGSSVYIGRLLIKKWLRKNIAILKNKKLFLFVVCGGGATDKQQQEAIINTNLPAILSSQCDVYFMPGRLDIKKLSWTDKWKLRFGAALEKDPLKKNVMRNGVDAVAKYQIAGLVRSVSLFASNEENISKLTAREIPAQ